MPEARVNAAGAAEVLAAAAAAADNEDNGGRDENQMRCHIGSHVTGRVESSCPQE